LSSSRTALDIQSICGLTSLEDVGQSKEHTDGGDNGHKCHEHPMSTCHLRSGPVIYSFSPSRLATIQNAVSTVSSEIAPSSGSATLQRCGPSAEAQSQKLRL
jgi:hypothetical protein